MPLPLQLETLVFLDQPLNNAQGSRAVSTARLLPRWKPGPTQSLLRAFTGQKLKRFCYFQLTQLSYSRVPQEERHRIISLFCVNHARRNNRMQISCPYGLFLPRYAKRFCSIGNAVFGQRPLVMITPPCCGKMDIGT